METRNQTNIDPYQKWETMTDTTSFLGAGAFTCAIQGVSLIEPSGLGIILASGASALAIAGANRLLPAHSSQNKLLKVCAAVAAIALTTFSLPFLFTALGAHTIILLTSQTALQLFVINLIAKAAAFALFKGSLFLKNYLNFRLPENVEEIENLKSSELTQYKNYLLKYPAKAKELPLPYQMAFNQKLKDDGQEKLPLVSFSEVGAQWSKEGLEQLHREDLSHLRHDQRIVINSLFINHELLPQKRSYAKEELPDFDSVLKEKKITQAAKEWVRLGLLVDPTIKLPPKVLKKLEPKDPPKDKTIDSPALEKPIDSPAEELDGRVEAALAALALVKGIHYVVHNFFGAAKSSLAKVPNTALMDLGLGIVREKFAIPDWVRPAMSAGSSALTLYESPESFLSKFVRAVAKPVAEGVKNTAQTYGTPVVTEIPPVSSSYLSTLGYLGLGAGALVLYAMYRNREETPSSVGNEGLERSVGAPKVNVKPPIIGEITSTLVPGLVPVAVEKDKEKEEEIAVAAHQEPLEIIQESPPMESIEVPLNQQKATLNWQAFKEYVRKHCPGVSINKAKQHAHAGIDLIQKLRRGEQINDPSEEQLRDFCWGAMLHAITKNEGFVEGTINIKDPDYRIFNFLFRIPSCYGRSSSHYPHRAILIEEGKLKDNSHFGVDLDSLPAQKGTVLFGKIDTLDKSHHTYFKMENYGANLNIYSDPNARKNIWQLVPHTFEFLISGAKKLAPNFFGEVGGGLNMRKEHLPGSDKKIIQNLIKEIQEQDHTFQAPTEKVITEYGFAIAIITFSKALKLETIQPELKDRIEKYIQEINRRYPNSPNQKGDEVLMANSILLHELEPSEMDESLLDSFEDVKDDGIAPKTDEQTAIENLFSGEEIKSGTVKTYANFLIGRTPGITFVHDFLFEAIFENREDKDDIITKNFNPSGKDGLIYIPFILKGEVWNLYKDHIVLLALDPYKQTYEYYDSQGVDLKEEIRKVKGTDLSANKFLEKYITRNPSLKGWKYRSNPNRQQQMLDFTNCGAFICWFMKFRGSMPFDEICGLKVDIQKEREILAEALQNSL